MEEENFYEELRFKDKKDELMLELMLGDDIVDFGSITFIDNYIEEEHIFDKVYAITYKVKGKKEIFIIAINGVDDEEINVYSLKKNDENEYILMDDVSSRDDELDIEIINKFYELKYMF